MANNLVKLAVPEGFELEKEKPASNIPEGFEIEQQEPETAGEKNTRNIVRSGARAGESLLGLPANFLNLIQEAPGALDKLFGQEPEIANKNTELLKNLNPLKKLKTSSELKAMTNQVSKGYTKPQTPAEAFSDKTIEFIAPFLVENAGAPGVSTVRKGLNMGRTVIQGLGANALGEAVKGLTGSEGVGDIATNGAYLLMSMIQPGSMGEYINNIYNAARQFGRRGINPMPEIQGLGRLHRQISRSSAPSPDERAVLNLIEEYSTTVMNKLANGEAHTANDVLRTRQSINQTLRKLISGSNGEGRKVLERYYRRLNGITNRSLRNYGRQNPEFRHYLEAGDEAFRTRAQSEFISNSLSKFLEGKKLPHLEKALPFVIGSAGQLIPGAGGISAAATPIYYAARFAYRYARSEQLRYFYNQMFRQINRGNGDAVRKISEKLNKDLGKAEEKEPFKMSGKRNI